MTSFPIIRQYSLKQLTSRGENSTWNVLCGKFLIPGDWFSRLNWVSFSDRHYLVAEQDPLFRSGGLASLAVTPAIRCPDLRISLIGIVPRRWAIQWPFGKLEQWIASNLSEAFVTIFIALSCVWALFGWVPCLFLSSASVLVDDGTPRIPFPLRIHLSLTVFRLKQMIEAQEGFTVGEQEVFFQGNPVSSFYSSVF